MLTQEDIHYVLYLMILIISQWLHIYNDKGTLAAGQLYPPITTVLRQLPANDSPVFGTFRVIAALTRDRVTLLRFQIIIVLLVLGCITVCHNHTPGGALDGVGASCSVLLLYVQ